MGVLVSGTGSILEAMLARGLPVGFVGADRRCRGLELAAGAGVDTVLLRRDDWTTDGVGRGLSERFDRDGYSIALAATLAERCVDVVAMAGFGTVLAGSFFAWDGGRYQGRVLNTHPSLLPAFPGWHAVRDALASGAVETGCTVHVATAALDSGPVLAQRAVPVLDGDSEATLHERIKAVERELYPAVTAAFLEWCEREPVLTGATR